MSGHRCADITGRHHKASGLKEVGQAIVRRTPFWSRNIKQSTLHTQLCVLFHKDEQGKEGHLRIVLHCIVLNKKRPMEVHCSPHPAGVFCVFPCSNYHVVSGGDRFKVGPGQTTRV